MKGKIEELTYNILKQMSKKIETGKRKKINTNSLEELVKKSVGGLESYRNNGGYPLFVTTLEKCKAEGWLSEMITSKTNSRFPAIKENFWLDGIKKVEKINVDKYIFEMGDLLDLGFYKVNKNYFTSQECLKIKRIYQFLRNKEKNETVVNREDRSLMLFYDLDTGSIEPEKYLSSSQGKAFLTRIGVNISDLNCEVIREPYKYWKEQSVSFGNINEILIIEGLATYNTLKKLMENDEWLLGGLKPQLLIFGGGKRILSSFEYTEELFGNRTDINIRYFGDLDPEGYTIYHQLKQRYKDYNINLDVECYRFMYEHTKKFSVKIHTKQSMDLNSFQLVSQELECVIPGIKNFLNELWQDKTRIAQEAMNLVTINSERSG